MKYSAQCNFAFVCVYRVANFRHILLAIFVAFARAPFWMWVWPALNRLCDKSVQSVEERGSHRCRQLIS